jgi:hypothetical protein
MTLRKPLLPSALLSSILCSWACAGEAPNGTSPSVDLGPEVFSVGELEGPVEVAIGEVKDIAVGASGDFYVLDSRAMLLRRYSPDGELMDAAGGEGQGPGEFRSPASLVLDPEGRVLVLDVAGMHTSRYQPTAAGLEFQNAHPIPFPASDFCLMGDRVFVLGLHEGHVVHEITVEGDLVRSFGDPKPFPAESAVLGDRFFDSYSAVGHILCDAESKSVVVLPHILPHLRRFTAEGDMVWDVELVPYSQTQFLGSGRGLRPGLDPETGTTNVSAALTKVASGTLLLQLVQESDQFTADNSPVDSRLVDLDTGFVIQLADTLLRIAATSEGRVYAWEGLPFPQVRVFPFELRGAFETPEVQHGQSRTR